MGILEGEQQLDRCPTASLASRKPSGRCPHRTPFGPRAEVARRGETACGAGQVSGGSELLGATAEGSLWCWRVKGAQVFGLLVAPVPEGVENLVRMSGRKDDGNVARNGKIS